MKQNDLNLIQLDKNKLNNQKKEKTKKKRMKEKSYKSNKNNLNKIKVALEVKIPKEESELITNSKLLKSKVHKKNRTKEESFLKRKRNNTELPLVIDKKSKSEDTNSKNISIKLFINKEEDFLDVIDKWKNVKSLEIDSEGNITHKLSADELILKNCQKIAIDKLKENKDLNYDEILNILSYDNTNQSLLYFCLEKMKKSKDFKNLILEYKFCFCDEGEIIDYSKDNAKKIINFQKEFNFKFIFSNVKEGINMLKDNIQRLLELASKYNEYKLKMRQSEEERKKNKKREENNEKNNILVYEYDNENKLKTRNILNSDEKELHKYGFNWLTNYMKFIDFENYKANQPFSYENNNILYLSFCIYKLYKPIIQIDKEKKTISLKESCFSLVRKISHLLNDLIKNLDNKCIDKEFESKIRFFDVLFEAKNAKISNIDEDLMKHIFPKDQKINDKDFKDFIKSKKVKDKENYTQREYSFSNNKLKIVDEDGIVEFNFKDYGKNLFKALFENTNLLNLTWKKNNLDSFQSHNFLLEEDINFLKETIRKIFKSSFWNSICKEHCSNDFTEINPFRNDAFVNQIFDRLIFFPFDINEMGLYAYTTEEDLYIFISGYPYTTKEIDFEDYKAYRILQLGVSVLVILHESIHFYKRLLYLLTCGKVSRTTIIDKRRLEGGNLFEKILFEEIKKNKSKFYINLKTAFNLLNVRLYEQPLENIRKILAKSLEEEDEDEQEGADEEDENNIDEQEEESKEEENVIVEEKKGEVKEIILKEDKLLKEFKKKLGFYNKDSFKQFMKNHKNITINATKELENANYGLWYNSSDHSKMNI